MAYREIRLKKPDGRTMTDFRKRGQRWTKKTRDASRVRWFLQIYNSRALHIGNTIYYINAQVTSSGILMDVVSGARVRMVEKTINYCVHAEYQNDSRIGARTYMYIMIYDGGLGGVATRPAAKVIREYNKNNNNVRHDTYIYNNIIYILYCMYAI